MNINNLLNKTFDFVVKRIAELVGLLLVILSILLFISLISYSPEDPNFIFPDNAEIKNILGYRGSYTSDLFFQSIGFISIFVSITIFFTGINVFRTKRFLLIIENTFYTVVYTVLGSLFFSIFYPNSFGLSINGNGGFIGKFFKDSFLSSLVNLNENVSYYVLVVVVLLIFLISINFNIKYIIKFIKIFFGFITNFKKNEVKFREEVIGNHKNENTQNESLIQENLPFSTNIPENKNTKQTFKLPSINFLKNPTKKEREHKISDDKIDESLLEKILRWIFIKLVNVQLKNQSLNKSSKKSSRFVSPVCHKKLLQTS